jgi:hypothetical protein
MAREEADREDLISEATALVDRAAFAIQDVAGEIVVGFRRDGSPSIYLTPDRVYQFNNTGELRRAYVNGILYKAERGRLTAMRRERTTHETALVARDLTEDETASFLQSMRKELGRFVTVLREGNVMCTRQVTSAPTMESGQTAETRAIVWLSNLPDSLRIARAAGIKHNR